MDEIIHKINALRIEKKQINSKLCEVIEKLEVQDIKLTEAKSQKALGLIKNAYVRTGTAGFYAVVDKVNSGEYAMYRGNTAKELSVKSTADSFFSPTDYIPLDEVTTPISNGSEHIPKGLQYDCDTEVVFYDILLEMRSFRLGWSSDETKKVAYDRIAELNVPSNVKILKEYGVNVSLDLVNIQANDMAATITTMQQAEDDLRELVNADGK
jgi:hypothetical protein|tara:strand:- start:294 stop:926 length:633 start_codon:yes stop_codon:yes gene_type:complete